MDTQGDPIMELALSDMFLSGEIRRHMKKALQEYHYRRDFLCAQLIGKLSDVIEFRIPDGGLALWAKFNRSVPLPPLKAKLLAQGIILSDGLVHNTTPVSMNTTRMGFAWMNQKESEKAVSILVKTISAK
jgi:GntR family transcriptional regulator/MocR family aminotransferase